MIDRNPSLSLLAYPYGSLHALTGGPAELRSLGRQPGAALIWSMAHGRRGPCAKMVCDRPGGLALLVILPPDCDVASDPTLMHIVQQARPHGILPFHPAPSPSDLAQVLRRPPSDLGAEVTDYLRWRGLGIDRDSAQLIRRIIDLTVELRSVSAVSRGMYLSRRALGRRLQNRGLPVPSHWIHFGRLLRVALKLQNSDATVSSVAFGFGYPDGFSVSNQMERLIGYRPSEVRVRLGWEWVLESWLRKEAEGGGLMPTLTRRFVGDHSADPRSVRAAARRRNQPHRGVRADSQA